VVKGTDCIGSRTSNYHTIVATTAPCSGCVRRTDTQAFRDVNLVIREHRGKSVFRLVVVEF
jgi:hypothetical protein